MKIILNKKQTAILSKLFEQTPDEEENVVSDSLIVNYRNKGGNDWRIFFNDITNVTQEEIKNSEHITFRGEGEDDTNL